MFDDDNSFIIVFEKYHNQCKENTILSVVQINQFKICCAIKGLFLLYGHKTGTFSVLLQYKRIVDDLLKICSSHDDLPLINNNYSDQRSLSTQILLSHYRSSAVLITLDTRSPVMGDNNNNNYVFM